MKKLLFGALLLQNFPAALASSDSPLPLTLKVLALTTVITRHATSRDNYHYQPATGFTTYPGKNTQHEQNALFQKNNHHKQPRFPKNNNGKNLRKKLSQNQ